MSVSEEDEDIKGVIKKSQNRRKTDNAMVKRERTKGQTMIYKTVYRKLKIKQKTGFWCSGWISSYCSNALYTLSLIFSYVFQLSCNTKVKKDNCLNIYSVCVNKVYGFNGVFVVMIV